MRRVLGPFCGLLAGMLLMAGCAEPTTTEVSSTPPEVIAPKAADETPSVVEKAGEAADSETPKEEEITTSNSPIEIGAGAEGVGGGSAPAPKPEPTPEPAPAPATEPAKTETPGGEQASAAPAGDAAVELVDVTFDELKSKVAANDAKYTLVDAWASWCGPCKENFPHVLEMAKKYGGQGLAVYSLSLDGGTGEAEFDAKEISAAKQFLAEQKSSVPNYRLNEERDQQFEKLDMSTIPAVFVYDADGKEVKRYTWDDPNNQFTYDQVEADVKAMLEAAK